MTGARVLKEMMTKWSHGKGKTEGQTSVEQLTNFKPRAIDGEAALVILPQDELVVESHSLHHCGCSSSSRESRLEVGRLCSRLRDSHQYRGPMDIYVII